MPINGLRTTANFVTDQRPKNWRETILLLYPNGSAPLTALTSLMGEEKTDDPEFNWWEKEINNRRLALTAAITTGTTNLTVSSNALAVKQGDVLYIEQTGEIVIVSSDPTADTGLTVQRGKGGTTATSLDPTAAGKNPYMRVIGSAYEEGSNAPTGVNFDPTKKYNYTQIFRNTLEMTRTASKTRLRTGDQVKEAKRECLELHSIDMEMAFIFGGRLEDTYNGKPRRTTGGIISFIDSNNIVTAGATTTMTILEGWMKRIFDYGSSEKIAFCGNQALMIINQVCRLNSQYQIDFGVKEYGMRVARLVCPFGELVLKGHPLFNQMASGTTSTTPYYGTETWMLVVDPKNLKYRYVDDTKYEKDLQENGLDGMKSGYLSECGLEIRHPKTHFLIKSLVAGAAG